MKKFWNFITGQESDTPTPEGQTVNTTELETEALKIGKGWVKSDSVRRLMPLNIGPTDNLYDTIALVIYCPEHNKIAVSRTNISKLGDKQFSVWLPFIYVSPEMGWGEGINKAVALVLNIYAPNETGVQMWRNCILNITRIQLPSTQRFITRVISLTRLELKEPHKCNCNKSGQDSSRIYWSLYDKVKGVRVEDIWGEELKQFSSKVNVDLNDTDNYQTDQEVDLNFILKYVGRKEHRNDEENMLYVMKVSDKTIERVFRDFYEHCFPAFTMTFPSFENYMKTRKFPINLDKISLTQLFDAFTEDREYLTFHDLFLGLAALEPELFNGLARLKRLFKYFDKDKDNFLSSYEFKLMISDINEESSTKVLQLSQTGVELKGFVRAVTSGELKNIRKFLRADHSLFSTIMETTAESIKDKLELEKMIAEHTELKIYQGECSKCTQTTFEICPLSVKFTNEGRLTDPQMLTEIKDVLKKQTTNTTKNEYLSQRYIIDMTLNEKCLANHLIKEIIAFNAKKGTREDPKGLLAESNENREILVKYLEQLANEVIPIFLSEKRCIKVSSPAFVIGDIHGNLEDLLTIEKHLFRSAPLVAANYVFLGDYVDRGKWSVECAIFMLCLKVLSPTNFILLRGNHETRFLQKIYTFTKECHKKYDSFGDSVHGILNMIFDSLPLTAVVDDHIFCCHAGIPSSAPTLNEINKIKNILKDVEKESKPAWEIIWNDPVEHKDFRQTVELMKQNEDISRGFVNNMKRGTGYFFNEFACHEFLKKNSLSFIIRGHEVPLSGYRFNFGQKCLTIFSSSHYCGAKNKVAVVLIVDNTIRIVQLDTDKNAPATDISHRSSRKRNKH